MDDFGYQLSLTRTQHLSPQKGATAQAGQEAFAKGEDQSKAVSNKNDVKSHSYREAADAVVGLQSELRGIAGRGNQKIDEIIARNGPTTVAEVVAELITANGDSSRRSGEYSQKIGEAIQKVLTADGDGRTPEQFAKDNGIDFTKKPQMPSEEELTKLVTNKLEEIARPGSLPGGESTNNIREGASNNIDNAVAPTSESSPLTSPASLQGVGRAGSPSEPAAMPPSTSNPPSTIRAAIEVPANSGLEPAAAGGQGLGSPGSFASGPSSGGSPGTLVGSASAAASAGGNPSLPSPSSIGAGSQPLSPESLAQSFNTGMQAGGPASAGAEALSQGISDTVQSQTPQNHAPPPAPVAPTVPSSGFAYEAPQQYSEPVQAAPATETHAQPMYAAPVAAAPAAPMAPMAAAPPAATAGPLPAYGSDLRPATAAAPPPPAAPAPMSAPTSAASGTAASNQAPVVRQQNMTTPGSTTTPTGIVESALTSATAGAVAGAAAEQSAAQARLDRLLEAVARQEPKLKWAIGDREDGSTVLVTDLAAGWIPPHIEIPKGVQLLPPERRRGGLEHLLGETVDHSIWTPGHYLPNAKDVEPVEMTYRARKVPDIDELNWELTQATNWRDGLPRLAHTLTKAGIAGTGVLETEADLLYEHLTTVRNKVVKSYPDSVDANDVGNWQLLAAISGLISSDKTTLKYHFAWFQALSMAKQGGAR